MLFAKKIVKCIAYKNTGNLIYIKYMKHIYVKKQVYLVQGSFQQNKFDKAPAARSRFARSGSELLKTLKKRL